MVAATGAVTEEEARRERDALSLWLYVEAMALCVANWIPILRVRGLYVRPSGNLFGQFMLLWSTNSRRHLWQPLNSRQINLSVSVMAGHGTRKPEEDGFAEDM